MEFISRFAKSVRLWGMRKSIHQTDSQIAPTTTFRQTHKNINYCITNEIVSRDDRSAFSIRAERCVDAIMQSEVADRV